MSRTIFLALAAIAVTANAYAVNCTFLPERPMPAWVEKRPDLPGQYGGVGVAGPMTTPQEQMDASQANALSNLAKEIAVSVKSSFTDVATQQGQWADQEISAETETRVAELIRGAAVREKWLDRRNCQLWTLVSVPKGEVEAMRREIDDRIRKKFTSKKLMLFPLANSAKPGMMDERVMASMGKVLQPLGVGMLTPDQKYLSCARGEFTPICGERGDTMYGGFTLAYEGEKLSADGAYKARFYLFKGSLYFKERTVSVFSVKCRGVGGARDEAAGIDLNAADQCVAAVRKNLERDLQGSE